ncbi:MAG TPA: dephospho-CoA kinase [Beijerinckiaceae bacterium]|jgi:dephospho-CoA kinase
MLILGLTGSIGMGKSTTADLFRREGVPVHDSDAAVHELYRGAAVPLVGEAFPEAVREGVIDRAALARRVVDDPDALRRLEAIVHPLVAAHRQAFLDRARAEGRAMVVLDVPLLFETNLVDDVDVVVVVSAPADIQRQRVLARPGMTAEKFESLLARQTPDDEKRRRAHHVIDTSGGLDDAARQVRALVRTLTN